MIADRAARLQDPVSPARLIEDAIGRIEAWSRSPLGREVARSTEVDRSFAWAIARSVGGESVLFRGRTDFLYRRASGELGLVILSDPGASGLRERLRLLLSVLAAKGLGRGVVTRADWVRFGEAGRQVDAREFDEASIDREVLGFLNPPPASKSPDFVS